MDEAGAVGLGEPIDELNAEIEQLREVLETSDVPAGVVNIVTGRQNVLARVLAAHDDVDALWYFGTADGARQVE